MKKPKMFKNTHRMKAKANGFYTLNGNNVIDFKESSKAKDVYEFLERIKEENEYDPIVVLDNSKTHHTDVTIKKAEKLNIILVFLPPYSPGQIQLNLYGKVLRRKF